jgi:hypothetical protein
VAGKEMETGRGRKKEEVEAEKEYDKEEGRTEAYQQNVMVVIAHTPLLATAAPDMAKASFQNDKVEAQKREN